MTFSANVLDVFQTDEGVIMVEVIDRSKTNSLRGRPPKNAPRVWVLWLDPEYPCPSVGDYVEVEAR